MKKFLLLSILILFSFNRSIAQNNWGGGVDDEQLHFGFKFQYISSEYKIQKIENWKGPFIDPFNGLPMINSQLTSLSSPVTPGFGLGFERMVMFVTGMSNIRDVIPFPRTPLNAEF